MFKTCSSLVLLFSLLSSFSLFSRCRDLIDARKLLKSGRASCVVVSPADLHSAFQAFSRLVFRTLYSQVSFFFLLPLSLSSPFFFFSLSSSDFFSLSSSCFFLFLSLSTHLVPTYPSGSSSCRLPSFPSSLFPSLLFCFSQDSLCW